MASTKYRQFLIGATLLGAFAAHSQNFRNKLMQSPGAVTPAGECRSFARIDIVVIDPAHAHGSGRAWGGRFSRERHRVGNLAGQLRQRAGGAGIPGDADALDK